MCEQGVVIFECKSRNRLAYYSKFITRTHACDAICNFQQFSEINLLLLANRNASFVFSKYLCESTVKLEMFLVGKIWWLGCIRWEYLQLSSLWWLNRITLINGLKLLFFCYTEPLTSQTNSLLWLIMLN